MDAIIERLGTIADLLARIATALENQGTVLTSEEVERRNRTRAPGQDRLIVDAVEMTERPDGSYHVEILRATAEGGIHAGPDGLGVSS